ncbi:MAG TPA: carboxypeptidase-like regulatory domain-containing protein [Patescibacteria group bacterium]|nr:carboxypeptidase-like regulatory domain-containing protein [Patescibacteria group bacterium]
MARRLVLAGLLASLAVAALVLAAPATAEHEVYYRFSVLGYVKDAQDKPIANAKVEVVRDKTGFLYLGETDAEGFYFVRTRLGDESRGEALTVRQGTTVHRITVAFDPANQTDERGTRVDFEGARTVERAAWFRSTLLNVIGVTTRH